LNLGLGGQVTGPETSKANTQPRRANNELHVSKISTSSIQLLVKLTGNRTDTRETIKTSI